MCNGGPRLQLYDHELYRHRLLLHKRLVKHFAMPPSYHITQDIHEGLRSGAAVHTAPTYQIHLGPESLYNILGGVSHILS